MLSTFSIDSLLFLLENKEERNILYAFLSAVVKFKLCVSVWLMVIGELNSGKLIANISNSSLNFSFKTDARAVSVSFRF